jgi:5-oxopent-3-ene-1,2,5-tricarboxylate decarboxylase/2-hydroxyhepta-2,4-diene-1,7-dioate isomerase
MKGTIFAVALNHRSQLDAWREAFQQAPTNAAENRGLVYQTAQHRDRRRREHSLSAGRNRAERRHRGADCRQNRRKVAAEDAAAYIAGYALANDVSLPEESFYRPAIKAKCRDGFCPLGALAPLSNVDNLTIITEINGREADSWNTADLQRSAAELLSALSEFATLNPGDAILIGTPHSRVTLRPGDRVRILAEGFPALENPVVAEGELA